MKILVFGLFLIFVFYTNGCPTEPTSTATNSAPQGCESKTAANMGFNAATWSQLSVTERAVIAAQIINSCTP